MDKKYKNIEKEQDRTLRWRNSNCVACGHAFLRWEGEGVLFIIQSIV
jgi:hypothetical protein